MQFTLIARGNANRRDGDGRTSVVGPGCLVSPAERLVLTAITPVLVFVMPTDDASLLHLTPPQQESFKRIMASPPRFEQWLIEQHCADELSVIKGRDRRLKQHEREQRRQQNAHMLKKWRIENARDTLRGGGFGSPGMGMGSDGGGSGKGRSKGRGGELSPIRGGARGGEMSRGGSASLTL